MWAPKIDQGEALAAEVRYVIGGSEEVSRKFRVVVLRKNWQSDPWTELPENERPDRWDGRLTIIVLPEHVENIEFEETRRSYDS